MQRASFVLFPPARSERGAIPEEILVTLNFAYPAYPAHRCAYTCACMCAYTCVCMCASTCACVCIRTCVCHLRMETKSARVLLDVRYDRHPGVDACHIDQVLKFQYSAGSALPQDRAWKYMRLIEPAQLMQADSRQQLLTRLSKKGTCEPQTSADNIDDTHAQDQSTNRSKQRGRNLVAQRKPAG